MKNQFIYTRELQGEDGTAKKVKDSFNVTKVIRTVTLPNEQVLVLLDDIHERVETVPSINPKSNKMQGTKKERATYQSEIYLSKEDGERFHNLTSI